MKCTFRLEPMPHYADACEHRGCPPRMVDACKTMQRLIPGSRKVGRDEATHSSLRCRSDIRLRDDEALAPNPKD